MKRPGRDALERAHHALVSALLRERDVRHGHHAYFIARALSEGPAAYRSDPVGLVRAVCTPEGSRTPKFDHATAARLVRAWCEGLREHGRVVIGNAFGRRYDERAGAARTQRELDEWAGAVEALIAPAAKGAA